LEFTKPAQTHHTTSGQYCEINNIIYMGDVEKRIGKQGKILKQ
jgi:hypothetical protein